MATTSIWSVKGWLGKVVVYVENPNKTTTPAVFQKADMTDRQAQNLSDVIDYASMPEKTAVQHDNEGVGLMRQLVSGINCYPAAARDEMLATKRQFRKENGVIAYHGYQSFAPGEADPITAHEI